MYLDHWFRRVLFKFFSPNAPFHTQPSTSTSNQIETRDITNVISVVQYKDLSYLSSFTPANFLKVVHIAGLLQSRREPLFPLEDIFIIKKKTNFVKNICFITQTRITFYVLVRSLYCKRRDQFNYGD